jgi:hypothetical protein
MQPEFLRGLAATWGTDKNGTRYTREAFARTLRLFGAGRLRIPLVWGHDFDHELGELLELRTTDAGLEITARIDTPPTDPGPYGLSVGMVYDHSACDRADGELVVRDGIVREVSLGSASVVANQGGGPAAVLDQVATGFVELGSAGHAALPGLCPHCAAGLAAAVANPMHPAFDQLWHCPHENTTVQANVRAGRVTGWHFLSPVTAAQHQQMIDQRQRAAVR